jgi:hypothetical protein
MEPRPFRRGNSPRAKATDHSICTAVCEWLLTLGVETSMAFTSLQAIILQLLQLP